MGGLPRHLRARSVMVTAEFSALTLWLSLEPDAANTVPRRRDFVIGPLPTVINPTSCRIFGVLPMIMHGQCQNAGMRADR
jgi:hypothetical protein